MSPPIQQVRKVTINENSVLGASQHEQIPPMQPEPEQKDEQIEEVPERYFQYTDVKLLHPEFAIRRKNVKLHKMEDEFVNEMSKVLSVFSPYKDQYDFSLILLLCQVAEDFFIDRGCGETKKRAVIKVASQFFDSNEILLCNVVELMIKSIERSTLFKRNKTRILKFFWRVVSIFLKKS